MVMEELVEPVQAMVAEQVPVVQQPVEEVPEHTPFRPWRVVQVLQLPFLYFCNGHVYDLDVSDDILFYGDAYNALSFYRAVRQH